MAWIKAYSAKSKEMAARIKTLGLAGVTAYGIMNTVYYTLAFTIAWSFHKIPEGIGLIATWQTAAKVMSVVWAGSQVTKLLRFALAIGFAPKVDVLMRWLSDKTGYAYKSMFAIITVGCFLASAALFTLMIVSRAVTSGA